MGVTKSRKHIVFIFRKGFDSDNKVTEITTQAVRLGIAKNNKMLPR